MVKCTNSLYNSPLFCVPKKQGQGLRIVQDFRELNNNSHNIKYSMKEITECIGDIGRANSTIFSTLDLTSGFWQMKLDEDSQPLTAFTIPGKGQFAWVTSPMGLLGCPASFQRLMEAVLRNINNVLVYIDDLLIHTATHEEHLGESFRTTACQPFKNQFGQVCVWQSRGLLSGLYTNTSRKQTWSQQTSSNQRCQTTNND